MFGARCPKVFESETIRKRFESFESDGDTFSGWRVKDTEPFCGRYSLKNPWKIFGITEEQAGVLLTQHKMVGKVTKKKLFFFYLTAEFCRETYGCSFQDIYCVIQFTVLRCV